MSNDKKSIVIMFALTIAVVAVCAFTIVFIKSKNNKPVEDKVVVERKAIPPKVKEEVKEVEKVKEKVIEPIAPLPKAELTEEEKKAKEAEEWKQAGKEMMDMFQGSKMQELIHRRMTARNKQYLAELFEKYGIDPKTQDLIAGTITQSQSKFMQTMMESGYFQNRDDEDKRMEIGEKLSAINQKAEDEIKELAGDAFLADAQDKRKTELRNNYINRVDRSLKDNKMTDEQKSAMDSLYAQNQITEVEMFTLPKAEIDQRKLNINNGAQKILNEDQYSAYQKSNQNPFRTRGMGWGGRRGRRRR